MPVALVVPPHPVGGPLVKALLRATASVRKPLVMAGKFVTVAMVLVLACGAWAAVLAAAAVPFPTITDLVSSW